MSRHYLAMDGTGARINEFYAVVGYDRPTGAFFCQIWLPDDDEAPSYTDDCFDTDTLNSIGAIVPPELPGILIEEACGRIDPNYTKDWRPHAR